MFRSRLPLAGSSSTEGPSDQRVVHSKLAFSPTRSRPISTEPSLRERLHRWISRETSEEVANRFFPRIQETLEALDYDLDAPVSEEAFRQVKGALRQADITPSRMHRAIEKARRAEEEDLSTLDWIQSVEERAYSEDLAEEAARLAKRRLKTEFDEEEADLEKPPTAEEIFAFLLAWEELGGSSSLAASRELERRDDKNPPSN